MTRLPRLVSLQNEYETVLSQGGYLFGLEHLLSIVQDLEVSNKLLKKKKKEQ